MNVEEILKNHSEEELRKCKESPYYFASKYITIKGADGTVRNFTTYLTEKEFNDVVSGKLKLSVKKSRR